ncbi:hypothetical protein [Archangium lipolyticum]|uniref:hypothetical protein n=1 Tax=Archangium lipolyticum TaxID=2970465 RepID=UPI00214A05CF|nr:hypothetical protein [Archangium lipolyticum]
MSSILAFVFTGCITFGKQGPVQQMGWRAHATTEMLRLYDEYNSPIQRGVLVRKAETWAEYVLSDGCRRLLMDQDGDGHPEGLADTLSNEVLITAIDSNQDGRPELLAQEDGNGRFFEDTDRNGIFDHLRTVFAEGDKFRVRIWLDTDEDGTFEQTETWMEPLAMPGLKHPLERVQPRP